MTIEKNNVVSLNYLLTTYDKALGKEITIEKTDERHPFVFIYGMGGLLEEFEKNIKGLKKDDRFDFTISAKNGYGEIDLNNVVNVPIDSFRKEDGTIDLNMITIGNTIPMVDNEGHRIEGTVEEITSEYVRMDFNHPLAGMDLHFSGTVNSIRNATNDEIAHRHVHGEGGHHH
jgi:FKBP-type peptidyl-prolyl cis-trans isomerase SlyD